MKIITSTLTTMKRVIVLEGEGRKLLEQVRPADLGNNTLEQTLSRENTRKWVEAMKVEFNAHQKNKTWSLVNLPKGQKAIPCRWVYATKRNVNGEIERYKARLVAKGCNQRYGIDFHETYSPVVRYSKIRILLSLAVKKRMHPYQSTAYLNRSLQDEMYMQLPLNFESKEEFRQSNTTSTKW